MGYRGLDRLHPSDKASLGRDKDKRNGDQGTFNVVPMLGDERQLQCLDATVVAVIDGASVFGQIIDDMPMDDWPSRVRLVQVLSRQHRQRQRCGD